MIVLVSMQAALDHVRTATTQDEADLISKVSIASAIVLNHCKLTAIPDEWITSPPDEDALPTDDSPPDYVNVPGNLQAATLLIAGELFLNRESSNTDPLSSTVLSLLEGFRTPTSA